jgi:membrane-associated phospholipid phosphatase
MATPLHEGRRAEVQRTLPRGAGAAWALPTAAAGCVAFTILLGLVQGQWTPLLALDQAVAQALNGFVADRPRLLASTHFVTDLGARSAWRILLTLTIVYLLIRRLPRLALCVAAAGFGGVLLNRAVKAAVGRQRPELADPVAQVGGYAFPSGHTMDSAIGVSVLLLVLLPMLGSRWRRPAVLAATLLVLAVGLSRIALGAHWLSDVVGGWLLALTWTLAVGAVFRVWHCAPQHVGGARPGAHTSAAPRRRQAVLPHRHRPVVVGRLGAWSPSWSPVRQRVAPAAAALHASAAASSSPSPPAVPRLALVVGAAQPDLAAERMSAGRSQSAQARAER